GTGIAVQVNTNATGVVEIKNNTVSCLSDDGGIAAIALGKQNTNPGGTLDVTITGNHVTTNANATYDIETRAAANGSDRNSVCANVASNTTSAAGIAAFRARVASPNGTLDLQGFNTSAATTWANNGNTPTTAGAVSQ